MYQSLSLPEKHPYVPESKIAVLLVNLGTPEQATASSIRRYLSEFLTDPRVIELPKLLWYPILYGIILNIRPKKLVKNYRSIWNNERDLSPLSVVSDDLCRKLQEHYHHQNITFSWAMCYGDRKVENILDNLKNQGHDRIIFFPLYPQYSASTTASAVDKALYYLLKKRWQPTIRFSAPYFDHPYYITAISKSIKDHLRMIDYKMDKLFFSFHGLPQRYFDKGDPYHCHCHKTARLVSEELGITKNDYIVAFQSRFGKDKWITPYSNETLRQLPKQGIKNIIMVAPGFSADCLETLEEIKEELCEDFMDAGGKNFSYISCLNASDNAINMYKALIDMNLKGWV